MSLLPAQLAVYLRAGTMLTFGDGHPYCRQRYHIVRMWSGQPPVHWRPFS